MPTLNSVADKIDKEGEPVVLRRVGQPSLPLKGFIRSYGAVELVGDIQQGDREVRISNRDISNASWAGPPIRGDKLTIRQRTTTIQSCETRTLRGVDCLHIIQVRG